MNEEKLKEWEADSVRALCRLPKDDALNDEVLLNQRILVLIEAIRKQNGQKSDVEHPTYWKLQK